VTDRTISVALQLKLSQWESGWKSAVSTVKRSTDDLATSVKKNKAELNGIAKGFGAVGLVAAAGLAFAVKKSADFEAAISKVRAATHETAGNMKLLRDAALDAGAKTAFSATQAANAVENLAKAGVSTKDILGGGLAGALSLAAAGELDVGQAAETAATAMTQFKLSGKDIPHIADLLAAGAGKAQGEVTDMAQALNQSGLVAAQFGLSIEETVGTLASFAAAGLTGSDAGTSFKTMLLRLANPSQQAADAMKELGINVHNAQGEFIGSAPLAEQLRSKLSKLTDEQRDAALATIFGSDAIRAANVLYSNGAKGITDWTNKVNDAGFAAETAALKQDNLRGDVEKLGGSFDTALIKIGEKANGPLRAVTQEVTALVDAFGELPGSVQGGVVLLGSVAAVGGLAAGGLLKTATAAAEAKAAYQALGTTGRRLVVSLGAVGLVLGAAVAIYGVFAKRNQDAAHWADELRATLDEQTGAITANTRAYVSNEIAQSGLAQKAKELGLSLPQITNAALGNKQALDGVVNSLDAIVAAGTTVTNTGKSGLVTQFSAQAQTAKELKQTILGLSGTLTDEQRKQRLAAEGAEVHQTAQQKVADAVRAADVEIKKQVQDLNDIIDAMHRASNAALTLSGAQIAYQAALDDASSTLKDNGKTLDINTEKGRANRAALNDIAKSANDQTDALLRSGKGYASASKNASTARADFSRVAQSMGLSKRQADALAKALVDVPKNISPRVTVPGAKTAKTEVKGVDTALRNVPKERDARVSVSGAKAATGQVWDLFDAINQLHNKSVVIRYSTTGVNLTAPSRASRVDGKAGGGIIPGPPSSRDNLIVAGPSGPLGLATGEFVVNARQTAKHRSLLEAVNSGIDGFASGGVVGAPDFKGRSYELTQLTAGLRRLEKSLDKTADRIGGTADRIKSLVQQRGEFAAATTSSFTGSLFGSGTSSSDLKMRLDARANDAKGMQRSLALLRKKGLNSSLWAELSSSSDYGAASQLAAMSPAQLAAINRSYASQQRAVKALGGYAGGVAFNGQIGAAQRELITEQAAYKGFAKALKEARLAIVRVGGQEYLKSVSGS